MADWTQIPDATFDTDRPVLGSTHLAIVRNFEALTEGAPGAPRVEAPAIGTFISRGTGLTTGGFASTDLDSRARVLVIGFALFGNLRFRLSTDNGSTWSLYVPLTAGIALVNLSNGQYISTTNAGTVSGSNFNAIEVSQSSGSGGAAEFHYFNRGI